MADNAYYFLVQHVPEPTRILNINLGASLSHDSSISSEGIDELVTFGSASRRQTSPLDDSTTSDDNVRRKKSRGRFFSSVGSWYQRRRVRVK